jgi:hypothetical protein
VLQAGAVVVAAVTDNTIDGQDIEGEARKHRFHTLCRVERRLHPPHMILDLQADAKGR